MSSSVLLGGGVLSSVRLAVLPCATEMDSWVFIHSVWGERLYLPHQCFACLFLFGCKIPFLFGPQRDSVPWKEAMRPFSRTFSFLTLHSFIQLELTYWKYSFWYVHCILFFPPIRAEPITCQQGHQAYSGGGHFGRWVGGLGTTEEGCRKMTVFKATGIHAECKQPPGYDDCSIPSKGSEFRMHV